MSLRLPVKLAPDAGLRAVLHSLARQARRDVARLSKAPEIHIHNLRTGMKKYRSLLHLVRFKVKKRYRAALLQRVRMLKDGLAGSRDEAVIFKTVQRVLGEEATERLGLRCPCAEKQTHVPDALRLAAAELVTLTEVLDFGGLKKGDLKQRWKKTVRKSKMAMKAAAKSDNARDFHMWRKRTKDLWYQCAALSGLTKKIAATREPAQRLSDVLGLEHDLTIVLEKVKILRKADRQKLEAKRTVLRKTALAAD